MKNPIKNQKRGFTLMEVVLALAILIPAVFAIIGANHYMIRMSESSRRITTALQDAHTLIERIRNTSEQGLNQVTAAYPSGGAVAGFLNLPGEQITVTYPSASADPLAITVMVNWTDQGRAMSRSLSTQVTQR